MPDPVVTPGATGGLGGDVASIIDLIRGLQGHYTNIGNTAAGLADPFASQRPAYQKELSGLLTDPSSFKMDPGAIFARDQGLEGVARFGNSMFGTTRSGNTADTLNRDATGYAAHQYNKRIDQLMTLSGATTGSPAAASEQYVRGNQTNDQAIANGSRGINDIINMLTGAGGPLAGLGTSAINAIRQLFGGGGGGGNFTTNPNAPGGGGLNGTGDGPAGPGGDAPGSGGDQYVWPDTGVIQDPWTTEPGFGGGIQDPGFGQLPTIDDIIGGGLDGLPW
jgi:hypothetical protein